MASLKREKIIICIEYGWAYLMCFRFFSFHFFPLGYWKKRRFHYTHSYFWIMKRSTVDGLKMAGSYYLPFIWFCSFFCKPIFIFSELWERAYFSNIYGVWFLVKDFFRLIWLDFCWTLLLYLFIQYYIKKKFLFKKGNLESSFFMVKQWGWNIGFCQNLYVLPFWGYQDFVN